MRTFAAMTTQDIQKLISSRMKKLESQIGTEKPGAVETEEEWNARQAGLSMAINELVSLGVEIDRKFKD
jgi:hypothetical protein